MKRLFLIQRVMSRNHSKKINKKPENTIEEPYSGCIHFKRLCKVKADCCDSWHACRLCHDEESDHSLQNKKIQNILCVNCNSIQTPGKSCIKCSTTFSRYYCEECKHWDNDPNKNIYHCKDCGICRIGKGLGQDYFHCQKCGICINSDIKNSHKCIERNLQSDCPICGKYMFNSNNYVIFMVSANQN